MGHVLLSWVVFTVACLIVGQSVDTRCSARDGKLATASPTLHLASSRIGVGVTMKLVRGP